MNHLSGRNVAISSRSGHGFRNLIAARCAPRSVVRVSAKATADWLDLPMKHVVDSNQFSKRSMDAVFAEALKMEKVSPSTPESSMLRGYIVSTLFYEPSTRTRLSFESAM